MSLTCALLQLEPHFHLTIVCGLKINYQFITILLYIEVK